MAAVDPFIAPVNAAGLPLRFCPRAASSDSQVRALSPAEVARHYWLLERVEVAYSLTVNGVSRGSRAFTLVAEVAPGLKRLCQRPLLLYNSGPGEDPVGLGITARVANGDPRLSEPFDGTYTIDVGLGEGDTGALYAFGVAPVPGWVLVATRDVTFLGSVLTTYLSVNRVEPTGSIDTLSLTPFWAEASPTLPPAPPS